jgi:hypothetical protein
VVPEARELLVKVKYDDGGEDWFNERDALVYQVGEYYVVINHDSCRVVYNKDLLSALKEFCRSVVSAEVVEE